MRTLPRKIAVAALLLAGSAALAGCGPKLVDDAKTEIAVRYDVEEATGVDVKAVDCPEGVEARPGNRFACSVETRGGERALAELEVLNDRADLRMVRLSKP